MLSIYFMSWILPLWITNPSAQKVIQTPSSIEIYGSCWDGATGVDLKVAAFVQTKGRKIKIGESDAAGIFKLQLPVTAESILFTYTGYDSILLPTHFIGEFPSNSQFRVGLKMNTKGTPAFNNPTQAVLSLTDADTTDVEYIVKREKDMAPMLFLKSEFIKKIRSFPPALPIGDHVLVASSKSGQWLYDEEFTIKEGLNFMDIHKKNHLIRSNLLANKSFEGTVLYFDQSSYQLRREVKESLDSIAALVKGQGDKKLQITGFTDNVGQKQLNRSLSEYRTKAVSNYLSKKGIASEQMVLDWKGSDSAVNSNDTEKDKIHNRRVVIKAIND